MLESGDNRRGPVSTSGGKEIVRGMTREDTLAVLEERNEGRGGVRSGSSA